MGVTRATGIAAWWGDVYFSPYANEISFDLTPSSPTEITNFASTGIVERLPSTISPDCTISGFVHEQATKAKFTSVTEDHWLTVVYRVPVIGDFFYSANMICTNAQQIGGPVGGAQQMSVTFANGPTGVVLRGKVLHAGTTTSSGNTAGLNFGALLAGETLYHVYHVDNATISGTSPTLADDLQRSATDSWGAPTTVYSLATTTDAPANTYIISNSETGAQAETWYRDSYTIGGTDTPSFRWFSGIASTALG